MGAETNSGIEGFASVVVERAPRKVVTRFSLKGHAVLEFFDPFGNLYATRTADNGVCTAAADSVLNVYFRGATPITAWYMGLVDNTAFTTFAPGDTMAAHGGWVENSSYSLGTRPVWSPGASSSGVIVNGTQVSFTMSASGLTLRGIFVASDSTKGGATGLLYSTAPFNEGNQAANSGDVVKLNYTVTMTPN